MKKVFIYSLLVVLSTVAVRAEKPAFEYSFGTDVVSSYVFRGTTLSVGPSIQPAAEISYAGLTFGTWANAGVFDSGANELDLFLNYSIGGFSIGATHFYYFDGVAGDDKASFFGDGTQTEVMLSYTISDEIPLSVSWYTMVGGSEKGYLTDLDKRAFSSYIELGYSHSLPYNLSLSYTVGMSPWTGCWGEGFTVPNLSTRLDYELALGDVCTMNAFLQPVYNTVTDKFNCVLGCGFWF